MPKILISHCEFELPFDVNPFVLVQQGLRSHLSPPFCVKSSDICFKGGLSLSMEVSFQFSGHLVLKKMVGQTNEFNELSNTKKVFCHLNPHKGG